MAALLPTNFEVSSDPDRLDLDVVHEFLRTSYWAEGRERAVTELTVRNSLCFGGYLSGRQVAFGRIVTDRTVIGYLADVFVLPEFRSRGLGTALIHSILEHRDVVRLQVILLRTRDAHGIYRKFGFEGLRRPDEMMALYPNGHS